MTKQRLDHRLVHDELVATRSQAESYIRMGKVSVGGKIISKPGYFVDESTNVKLLVKTQFVSRAAFKLASVSDKLHLDFRGRVVLDVGSSTGGFTQYALSKEAKKVIAVDVGTEQLHPLLRDNPLIELHEKTDIRDFKTELKIDLAVIDVSFISITKVLSSVKKLVKKGGLMVAMVKPQFEARPDDINNGVVKNSAVRRQILKDFEAWCKRQGIFISAKADSEVAGEKGNLERFYLLQA